MLNFAGRGNESSIRTAFVVAFIIFLVYLHFLVCCSCVWRCCVRSYLNGSYLFFGEDRYWWFLVKKIIIFTIAMRRHIEQVEKSLQSINSIDERIAWELFCIESKRKHPVSIVFIFFIYKHDSVKCLLNLNLVLYPLFAIIILPAFSHTHNADIDITSEYLNNTHKSCYEYCKIPSVFRSKYGTGCF